MFKSDYQETFSQITASDATYRRILAMKSEKTKRNGTGIATKLLVAAVMISLLAVTASATGLASWFGGFFTETHGEPLSQGQVDYIEEKTQSVDLSQTVEGYTISLKQAITDGSKTYVALAVTAPEGIDLNQAPLEGYQIVTVSPHILGSIQSVDGDFSLMSYSTSWREDGDGKANTMDMVLMLDSPDDSFDEDLQWKIRIDSLVALCQNTALEQELAAKYAGQDVMYTDEEAQALMARVPLVEGDWTFVIRLENNSESREVLSAPVTTRAQVGYDDNWNDTFDDVTVNSIVLRGLSATISYAGEYADFSYGDGVRLVMKDGSETELWVNGGADGEEYFYVNAPIVLEEVESLIFPDGTKVPVV